jgi:hypothetical protein
MAGHRPSVATENSGQQADPADKFLESLQLLL